MHIFPCQGVAHKENVSQGIKPFRVLHLTTANQLSDGGSQVHHGNLVLPDPLQSLPRLLPALCIWDENSATCHERKKNVSVQRVVRQPGEHAEPVRRCESKLFCQKWRKVAERFVPSQNALWLPC